jgi:DNA topoisomerase-1
MGKNLVVVESPAKAKTINKILGKDFVVKSSMGHVRDLPIKNMGIDIKNGFEPKYTLVQGRKKIVDELKHAAKDSGAIYLAPDPDREGEAIAWHLKAILEQKDDPRKFWRVQYNEITPAAVRKAFENPGDIDIKRVEAQQARRILDRIVGYMVSPMLWRRIRRGLSAGRVQSVALRLVCEREDEIRHFVPEEYWIMGAKVRKLVEPLEPFRIKLIQIDGKKAEVKSSEESSRVKSDLDGRVLKVASVTTRDINKRAPPPFITSTLQQSASSYYGYSPKRTMSIAQKLYEGVDLGEGPAGLITYMRTDSFTISQDALGACRDFIRRQFGEAFCPEQPNYFKNRDSSQEAHEAIRPTDVNRTPESLEGRMEADELKLYRLIWKRFVASQMVPAVIAQRSVRVDAVPGAGQTTTYLFQATASEIKFPGYMKVTGADVEFKEKEEDEDAERLPPLAEGESLECLEWLADRKETQPPPRYSEAALIKALEANGVGRPSTYAQILSTLYQREYVRLEKRSLMPSELGEQVNKLLVETLNELFNVKFTASMEESLDEIEKGSVQWSKMLGEFYQQFDGWMVKTKLPSADNAVVARVLSVLEKVQEWAPEVKRGKRTYSDKKFVESIREQLTKGEKEISNRQLEVLMKIGYRYRSQVPDIEAVIRESGKEALLSEPGVHPPAAETVKKLEILKTVSLDESTEKFIASLRSRVEEGRSLSPAQLNALNRVVSSHAIQIQNFGELKEGLGLGGTPERVEDSESGPLLEAMKNVTAWKAPVTRGKMVFNDQTFYQSLSQYFARKGYLSDRQRAALKKVVARYQDQIPDYALLAERFGLKVKGISNDA